MRKRILLELFFMTQPIPLDYLTNCAITITQYNKYQPVGKKHVHVQMAHFGNRAVLSTYI